MKIGLLGYGTVGGGVFDLCAERRHIEVSQVLCLEPKSVPEGKGTLSAESMLADEMVDTIVEVLGGLHPSFELVSEALRRKKNVVTANKFLVSAYYKELTALARENGVAFRCTAAVGGGIPWLVNLERARRCDTITRIGGILNGTTNYILDTMHHSPVPFADALASAQQLGYAEADPSADIDGADICRKLAISANIAFDACITPEEIDTFGIRTVTDADISAFAAHGYTCKLLASARLDPDGQVAAWVEPSLLGPDWPEATVPANYNLISMEGKNIGKESFFGQGAGRWPTAYNVVEDLIDIANGQKTFYTEIANARKIDNGRIVHRYYLRTAAPDFPKTDWAEKDFGPGLLTKPIAVAQIHALAHTLKKTDPGVFIAAVL